MRRKIPGSEKGMIALCLLLILFIAAGFPILRSRLGRNSAPEDQSRSASGENISDQLTDNLVFTDTSAPSAVSFSDSGQLFPDSSERALTEEEIRSLKDIASTSWQYRILIRLAINEIYARKGLHFNESGPFWSFYAGFDWYRESVRDGVGDGDLTELEKDNVSLLTRIEKEEREAAQYYEDGVELIPLRGTYDQARRYATCLGGNLVKITDSSVQETLQGLLQRSAADFPFWTAGYCQDGRWWWDETNPVDYSAWEEAEPSVNENGARLQVLPDGLWSAQTDLSAPAAFLVRYSR